MSENCCCPSNTWLIGISQAIERIEHAICNIQPVDTSDITTIKMMLVHNNPMTIAGNYPHVENDEYLGNIYVVSTTIRFLDMLNTNMYFMFKGDSSSSTLNLPVYFRDADYVGSEAAYNHAIVLSDGTPVLASQLLPNGIYKANYQYEGGYIILNSLEPLNPNIINI